MKLFCCSAAVLASAVSLSSAAPALGLHEAALSGAAWRAAQVELAFVRCSSIACADAVGRVRGDGPLASFDVLSADLARLAAVVLRDAGPAGAEGLRVADLVHVRAVKLSASVPVPLDSSCDSGCEYRFGIAMAFCSVLPPPADAICAGAAVGYFLACLKACSDGGSWSSGGGGGGGGGDNGGQCVYDDSCGDPFHDDPTVTLPRVLAALPRLAPYFSYAQLRQVARDVGVVLGAQ